MFLVFGLLGFWVWFLGVFSGFLARIFFFVLSCLLGWLYGFISAVFLFL
jgi:hypothetical protein